MKDEGSEGGVSAFSAKRISVQEVCDLVKAGCCPASSTAGIHPYGQLHKLVRGLGGRRM